MSLFGLSNTKIFDKLLGKMKMKRIFNFDLFY
jgi:hypothetical protein